MRRAPTVGRIKCAAGQPSVRRSGASGAAIPANAGRDELVREWFKARPVGQAALFHTASDLGPEPLLLCHSRSFCSGSWLCCMRCGAQVCLECVGRVFFVFGDPDVFVFM